LIVSKKRKLFEIMQFAGQPVYKWPHKLYPIFSQKITQLVISTAAEKK